MIFSTKNQLVKGPYLVGHNEHWLSSLSLSLPPGTHAAMPIAVEKEMEQRE